MFPLSRKNLSTDFFREAERWIGFNTVTTRSNLSYLRCLQKKFAPLGARSELTTVRRRGVSFGNLLLRWGPSRGVPLLCNTHSDTVPPGPAVRWTKTGGRPFQLTRRAGVLYGLGVADVKLNLLCQWEALRRLQGRSFHRPLVLSATFGEEQGLLGARQLIASWRGPKPCLALVGEPSEGRLIHRHRSYLVFEWKIPFRPIRATACGPLLRWTVHGRSAHSSTPHLGENALEKCLNRVSTWKRGKAAFCVTAWDGGTAPNQVPAEAFLSGFEAAEGKRRFLAVPWEVVSGVLPRLKSLVPRGGTFNLGQVKKEGDSLVVVFDVRCPPETSVEQIERGVASVLNEACVPRARWRVAVKDPALNAGRSLPSFRVVRDALKEADVPVRWEEKKTCTEAGLYHAWGVPSVVWGPGRSTGNVHRPNECIAVSDLLNAVNFYEALFRRWGQE